MGCDIHFYVEQQDEQGKWNYVSFREFYRNKLIRELGSLQAEKALLKLEQDEYSDLLFRLKYDYWYHDRHYALFGLLAGVRDCDITPIDQPRGMPLDVSEELRYYPHDFKNWTPEKFQEQYGETLQEVFPDGPEDLLVEPMDYHTFSWYSLTELLNYPWNSMQFSYECYCNPLYYKIWLESNKKKPPMGYNYSNKVKKLISNSEMEQLIASSDVKYQEQYTTKVVWSEKYKDLFSGFIQVLDLMKEISEDTDKVRAVFYFDN